MDDVANLSGMNKPIDLVHVQRGLRLFLGVTTKADTTTSNGNALCEWALNAASENPPKPVFDSPAKNNDDEQ
jgi:hypothetical protein